MRSRLGQGLERLRRGKAGRGVQPPTLSPGVQGRGRLIRIAAGVECKVWGRWLPWYEFFFNTACGVCGTLLHVHSSQDHFSQ